MINLSIQIKMIIFSVLYGITLYFFLNTFKKIIYNKNKKVKIIFTISFFLVNSVLYFLILKKINNAILDRNLLIMLIIGLYIGRSIRKATTIILKRHNNI